MKGSITLGIIVGNRGFFPAHLCDTGRKQILTVLEKLGIGTITLPTDATNLLHYRCESSIEFHGAGNPRAIPAGVREAWSQCQGWEVYHHD